MPSVTSDWTLQWGAPFGVAVSLLLGAALLVFCLRDAQEIRNRLQGPRRALLFALRGLTFMLGLGLLLQPQWVAERLQHGEGRVIALMDTSRSMGLPGDGSPRSVAAQAVLREVTSALPGAQVFEFGSALRPSSAQALAKDYPTSDDHTRILEALSAAENTAGDRLGAIVLVTDGVDSEGAATLSKEALKRLGTRVHTVRIGGDGPTRDDRITAVHADPVAFLRQQAEVEVLIERTPATPGAVPVSLYKDGALVAEVLADVDAAGKGRVVLPFDVLQLGRAVYTVSIPVPDGDVIPQNNERAFLMRVSRDRLRVLLVGGRPGWDAHFLRRFLKSRPSIDLITFFILRTSSDMSMAAPDELSLIPFPTDELFREHLHSFDLVIFQDFNYGPYQMARYLPRVRDFVMQGGAFAMVGGELSFSAGGYADTPIADILPVELPQDKPIVSLDAFQPVLAADMESHPLVELLPRRTDNRALWQRFATNLGANLLGAPKAGSSVLLTHPEEQLADGRPRPVLVTGEAGAGRTMALAIDSSYRWGFTTAGRTGDPSGYERFWDRALRFLTRDPSLEPAQVRTAEERYGPGADVQVEFLARARNYALAPDADLELVVRRGDDIATRAAVHADDDGRGRDRLQAPQRPGAYTIELRMDGEPVAEEAFVVESGGREAEQPFPDAATLKRIAKATGGQYFDGTIPDPAGLPRTATQRVGTERITPLTHVAFFALLCAALMVEWVVRRRWGLR